MYPSLFLQFGFISISVLLILSLSWLIKSKSALIIGVTWLLTTGFIAHSGYLTDYTSLPPRMLFILFPTFIGVLILAFSSIGTSFRDLSYSIIIGFQSFRIIIEFLIHSAVTENIAPPQMSWHGMNFDIIAGITAIPVALFASKLTKTHLFIWNTVSLFLVLFVLTVGALSIPSPIQQFTPDNTWLSYFPFLWLPTVAVACAVFGHIILFRKLACSYNSA